MDWYTHCRCVMWKDLFMSHNVVCFYVVHYIDVIMTTIASQITSLTVVYSIVYSRRRFNKTSKLRVTGLFAGNSPWTGEFPAQRASNAENVSIWWRHYDYCPNAAIWQNKTSALRHQAITWDHVAWSTKVFCGIHMRWISQEILMRSICKMSVKITFLKFGGR